MEPAAQVKLEPGAREAAYAALRAAPFAAAELDTAVTRWCAPRVKEHEHQGRRGSRFSTSDGPLRLDDLVARGRLSAEAAAGLEELRAQVGKKFGAETPAAAELLFRLRVLDRWQAFDSAGAEPAALGGRPAAADADGLELADGVDLSAEQEEELVGEGGLESVQVRRVGEPLAKRIKAEPEMNYIALPADLERGSGRRAAAAPSTRRPRRPLLPAQLDSTRQAFLDATRVALGRAGNNCRLPPTASALKVAFRIFIKAFGFGTNYDRLALFIEACESALFELPLTPRCFRIAGATVVKRIGQISRSLAHVPQALRKTAPTAMCPGIFDVRVVFCRSTWSFPEPARPR